MTQAELIHLFPADNSITDRVLLISPSLFNQLLGRQIQECRAFILITQGTLTLRVGQQTTTIPPNHFIDMLVWEPVEFINMSHDLHAWCLLPNYIFTNESLNGLKPADSESFKDRSNIPLLQLTSTQTDTLRHQLTLLLTALNNTCHHYRTQLCQTYFRSFMLESGNIMLQHLNQSDNTESIENRQDTILRSFLKLVWKYYKSQHNISFYAARLCLSSKHLSRVVRDRLSKTPHAVIRDELLQQACSLLQNSKMPVQEIAAELHFSEPAAFCKFFKKHKGTSPTAFRYRSRQQPPSITKSGVSNPD